MTNFWYSWGDLQTQLNRIERAIAQLAAGLNVVITEEKAIMATLTDIQAAVTAEKTVEDSVVTLLQQLAAQLKAALAANDPAAAQAIVDQINANAKALADAVAANTPAG